MRSGRLSIGNVCTAFDGTGDTGPAYSRRYLLNVAGRFLGPRLDSDDEAFTSQPSSSSDTTAFIL